MVGPATPTRLPHFLLRNSSSMNSRVLRQFASRIVCDPCSRRWTASISERRSKQLAGRMKTPFSHILLSHNEFRWTTE